MNIKYIIFIVIIYIIFNNFYAGYIAYYPSFPIYPSNKKEIILIYKKIKNRTQKDIDFFHLTNKSISYAFLPYVNESLEELDNYSIKQNHIIYFFKYLINRQRCWNLSKNIKPINIDTAQTPAYPAGHAYQAYLLSKILTKKYPEKKALFEELAFKCDECRVLAGLHYPSDGVFSKKLVNYFN